MTTPELNNERSRREWKWLVRRVGEDRARDGLRRAVARGRRAFPINAIVELGERAAMPSVSGLPQAADEPTDTGRAAAAAIREQLGKMGGRRP